jgi:Protein of unknown function (DUF5672)
VLKLPDVTLVLIETREHGLAKLALDDCERQAEFGDIIVFTDRPTQFSSGHRRLVEVPDWPTKMGWSRCFWQEVAPHLKTSHALHIQWDSFIVDPTMWRDEYLRYDFIGAPWPWYRDGLNVGNGGFCLRSTRLARFLRKHRAQFPCITDLDDDLLCRKYRPTLQQAGFEWAPEKLAYKFSFETQRPDKASRHFGFHAAYNFDYGCGGDEQRLLERARLMARSRYMTVTNPYFWKGFIDKHPRIAAMLETEHGRDTG